MNTKPKLNSIDIFAAVKASQKAIILSQGVMAGR